MFRMIIGRTTASVILSVRPAIVGIRVPAEGAATGMWLKDGPHVRVFWLAALSPVVDTWDGLTVPVGEGAERETRSHDDLGRQATASDIIVAML